MLPIKRLIDLYLQIDRSPFTNRSYAAILTRLADHLGSERDIHAITYADLLTYLGGFKDIKPSTLARYTAVIRNFFRWCNEQGFLEHSPAAGLRVRFPAKDRTKSRAVPPGDLQKLLDLVRGDVRDYALILFMADTGCRVGGAASLQISQLDLIENCAVLVEKGSKRHRVWFGDETAAALRAWLKVRPVVDHDYVFTTTGEHRPLKRESITILVRRAALKACGKVYSPHQIRHAVGHGLAHKGISPKTVQRKLGHSNIKTTLDFYYPDSDEEVKVTSREHSLASLGDRPKEVPKGKIIRLFDHG